MPDRRAFLAGMAALGAIPLAAQQQQPLGAAIIGSGRRGRSLLQQVVSQEGVKVNAICDIDAQARDEAQSIAARDKPPGFTEYRKVLELKNVDAVVIATPCDLHAEMAAAALAAGKHVYVEKPLGITPEQVDQVLRASRRAKTALQVGQQLRYMPIFREMIRQLHQEKVAGQTFVIKAQRHSTPVNPQAAKDRPAWYLDVKRSGDLIVENAVHNLDICNWVADSRPTSAYGHGKRYLPSPQPAGSVMMDGFSVEYIYDNDMHLDYSQLYLHPRALKELANGQWYMIFGEKGTVNLSRGQFYAFDAAEPRELVPAAIREGKENAMSDFFACIRENRKPFADVTVGAVAALTAIMGREAIYKRRMVTWKELGVSL